MVRFITLTTWLAWQVTVLPIDLPLLLTAASCCCCTAGECNCGCGDAAPESSVVCTCDDLPGVPATLSARYSGSADSVALTSTDEPGVATDLSHRAGADRRGPPPGNLVLLHIKLTV